MYEKYIRPNLATSWVLYYIGMALLLSFAPSRWPGLSMLRMGVFILSVRYRQRLIPYARQRNSTTSSRSPGYRMS